MNSRRFSALAFNPTGTELTEILVHCHRNPVGCDDDPDRFRERVGKLVKHKPVEKPE
jgi:hypothetical protein